MEKLMRLLRRAATFQREQMREAEELRNDVVLRIHDVVTRLWWIRCKESMERLCR